MSVRPIRLVTAAVAALALVFPAAGLAASKAATVDRGVVQSVGSNEIVLRTLDGSIVPFPVTARTRVRLNNAPASLTDVAPGFVASVRADRKGRALLIQAIGQPVTTTDRGIVVLVAKGEMTLRTGDGSTLIVAVDRKTRVRFRGAPARRNLVRPGALVAVTHAAGGRALVVNVLKRPGA